MNAQQAREVCRNVSSDELCFLPTCVTDNGSDNMYVLLNIKKNI